MMEKERKKIEEEQEMQGVSELQQTEEAEQSKRKQEAGTKEEIEQLVDNLTLMDDDLMAKVFDKNIPATQRVLRMIFGRQDIDVVSVKGQAEFENPLVGGRNIRLDVVAKEKTGEMSNIEVQRKKEGAHPRRARFHSSMLDSRMLKAGAEFTELLDSHMIFITEGDYFGKGLPIYSVDRTIRENGEEFPDGSHIIYVNGSYTGDDELGRLMKDFKCKNAKDMYYPELAEGVRHFKEKGGRTMVCEAVENFAKKYAAQIEAEKQAAEAKAAQAEAEIRMLRERLAKYESA